MKRSHIRAIVPETPLYVQACAVETHYVGLGQPPDSPEYRAFILVQVAGIDDPGTMIHVSLDDALFLRDAIDTVLERHRVITNNAN
jgi:hypothetical protein